VAVQHGLIRRFAGYEDPALGIRERFLTPVIGGGRTIAVLSEPLGDRASIGWVVCHSFGLEQDNLQSFEAQVARRLAVAGFPVLRFHSQGYGDSELPMEHVRLESHIGDAVEASAFLSDNEGVAQIGLIGARFGGAIAALAADRLDAAAVALLAPVIEGKPFMRSTIKSALVTRLGGGAPLSSGQVDPAARMEREGFVDVHGFPLRKEAYEEICDLDLASRLKRFRGRSLLVQVSRSATSRKDVQRLQRRFLDLGSSCRLEVLSDPDALRFGLPRLRAVDANRKVDSLARLTEALTAIAVSWCAGKADANEGFTISS
jgi:pimeloyl-ACP methyl ester carboxylesterase